MVLGENGGIVSDWSGGSVGIGGSWNCYSGWCGGGGVGV